jgi:hypothetical protein
VSRNRRPGPLRWIRGLVREDPRQINAKVLAFLADGPAQLVAIEGIAARFLDALLDRTDANYSDHATVYAGGQFLDSVASARELLCLGHVRGSFFHLRAMIETFAVMEYIHGDEERSRLWIKAEAPKERLKFSFEAAYRHAKRGETWKELWETFKDKTHSNYGAFPVQSRLRPVFGGDTWIGPFYDPSQISRTFLIVLALAQWFGSQLTEWYEADQILPDVEDEWNAIVGAYHDYAEAVTGRADGEEKELRNLSGTLPLAEQETALQLFERVSGEQLR